jgi:hypothetical protein
MSNVESQTVTMDTKGVDMSAPNSEKDQEAGVSTEIIDKKAERAYVRKLDFYLLPYLSLVSYDIRYTSSTFKMLMAVIDVLFQLSRPF